MNFWHLLRVIQTRKWMIVGVVAVTLLVVVIAAPKPKVVYQASAFMSPSAQVMAGGLSTTMGGDGKSASLPDRGVVLSNLIILAQGGDVYQRAFDFLALPVEEQKLRAPGLPAYKTISRVELIPGTRLTYKDWGDVLEAAPVQNPSIGKDGTTTDIIRLTVKLHNGDVAPYIANAVGHAFSESYRDKSREDTRKYAQFLGSSRTESRAKLHALQQKIAHYKTSRNVVVVDAETQQAITSLAGLEAEMSSSEAAVSEAEAALRDINLQLAGQPLVNRDPLPADMNPTVKKLREELAEAETDLRSLGQRYKPAHERYKAGEARVALLRERIAREGSTYAAPTINEIHQALVKKRSEVLYDLATRRARLAAISASVARSQGKINNLAQAAPELAELMREYEQEENTYKMVSAKFAETHIAEAESTKTGTLVAFDWARSAVGPIIEGPTRKKLVIYGFILSLIAGIMVAVWLDSIDNRMRNAADVEKLMELPVMGLTPKLTGRDGMLPKLTHIYPLSAMAESYRILRTNLLFTLRDSPFKTLMVATGRPGQGATTTICNLAIALAQIGKKIILIDADMRRPSLHKFFGVPNEAGLSTLLQGKGQLTDAFQKTEVDNLIVVPAGPQPLNPSELLGSDRMREIVERLGEHCDLVLFDTPSTIVFSDGPMLASWIDAVLMVVSANQVPRGTERQTRDLLRRARANILGVVVNRMSPDSVDSCYYYSHYYSDSVPGSLGTKQLDSGNGNGKRDSGEVADAKLVMGPVPKPIPASASVEESAKGAEESPFPD